MKSVRVNRKAAERVLSGHPWIFSSDLLDVADAQPGEVVHVIDFKGRLLGTAHYSSSSQIALRLLSRRSEEINREFLRTRIQSALRHRERVVHDSDACRLVHAEGDLLPGLIADRYGEYLVLQLLDQGMDRLTGELTAVLNELLHPKGIVARNDVAVRAKENLPLTTSVLSGSIPDRVTIHMNGLRWFADLLHGQKTGIFLDQRENYLAIPNYVRGGRALDCFTATGGFALHLASKCESVEAVDSSAATLETARANAAENNLTNVTFRQADVLEYLPSPAMRREFDVVVVDPPAFTKSRAALEGAIRGYKEINLRALRLLPRGGILVSCSCSHHMSEALLLETIAAASLDAGKQLRVLERRTQSADHPILLTVPETHYLKCLVLEVI